MTKPGQPVGVGWWIAGIDVFFQVNGFYLCELSHPGNFSGYDASKACESEYKAHSDPDARRATACFFYLISLGRVNCKFCPV